MVFLLIFFLSFGSDSLAQVYKYVDKEGRVSFTDNPTSSLLKDGISDPKGRKLVEVMNQRKKDGSEVKDILQLGHEILEKELAKPPEKQNRRLIREMQEILYGDVSGKKSKKRPY
jgi:hypothetical protein